MSFDLFFKTTRLLTMDGGIFKVTILVRGYVGVGKTSFCRRFVDLPEDDYTTSRPLENKLDVGSFYTLKCANCSNPWARHSKVNSYEDHCKSVNLKTVWDFLSPDSKTLIESDSLLLGKTSRIQISLIDTSGFDLGVDTLPKAMLRSLDALLLLISVDPGDMVSHKDTVDWCSRAYQRMMACFDGAIELKTDLQVQIVGSKCDLLFAHKDFNVFKDQTLKNNRIISDCKDGSFSKAETVSGSEETLAMCYLKQADGSPKIAGFMNRVVCLQQTTSKTGDKRSDTTSTLRLASAYSGCNVNIVIYKLVAKILDNYVKQTSKGSKDISLDDGWDDILRYCPKLHGGGRQQVQVQPQQQQHLQEVLDNMKYPVYRRKNKKKTKYTSPLGVNVTTTAELYQEVNRDVVPTRDIVNLKKLPLHLEQDEANCCI